MADGSVTASRTHDRTAEDFGHILVVDDEPLVLDLMKATLEDRGYRVSTASDGQEALERLSGGLPDLVVLDLVMPRLDGHETLRCIRRTHDGAALPVLVSTARVQSDDVTLSLDLGANDFVPKPVDGPVLLARIRGVLRVARAGQRARRSEARIASILESSLDGILVVDARGHMLEANPAAVSLLGLGPLLEGAPGFLERIGGAGSAAMRETLRACFRAGGAGRRRFEVELVVAGGRLAPVGLSVGPLAAGNGRLSTVVLHDLSAQRELERGLIHARAQELELGARIQSALLQGKVPPARPGLDIAATSRPSREIDGDFRDFYATGDQMLDVLVGDVMGKGVPAALMGAAVSRQFSRAYGTLPRMVGGAPDPVHLVECVSREMDADLARMETFVTAMLARLDLEEGSIQLVDCGHMPLIHVRPSRWDVIEHKGTGTPLGFGARLPVEAMRFPLQKGDVLVFYSDGLVEARDSHGQPYGVERLARLALESAGDPSETIMRRILQDLEGHQGAAPPQDDVTLVVIQITACPGAPRDSRRMTLPREPGILATLRAELRALAETSSRPWDMEIIRGAELVLTELVANVIDHARAPSGAGVLDVTMITQADRILVQIDHEGPEFDASSVADPCLDGSQDRGYGLFLVRQLAPDLERRSLAPGRQRTSFTVRRAGD